MEMYFGWVLGIREDGDQGLTSPLAVQYKLHTFRLRGWHGLSQIREKKKSHPQKGASTNLIKALAGRRENHLFGKEKKKPQPKTQPPFFRKIIYFIQIR